MTGTSLLATLIKDIVRVREVREREEERCVREDRYEAIGKGPRGLGGGEEKGVYFY